MEPASSSEHDLKKHALNAHHVEVPAPDSRPLNESKSLPALQPKIKIKYKKKEGKTTTKKKKKRDPNKIRFSKRAKNGDVDSVITDVLKYSNVDEKDEESWQQMTDAVHQWELKKLQKSKKPVTEEDKLVYEVLYGENWLKENLEKSQRRSQRSGGTVILNLRQRKQAQLKKMKAKKEAEEAAWNKSFVDHYLPALVQRSISSASPYNRHVPRPVLNYDKESIFTKIEREERKMVAEEESRKKYRRPDKYKAAAAKKRNDRRFKAMIAQKVRLQSLGKMEEAQALQEAYDEEVYMRENREFREKQERRAKKKAARLEAEAKKKAEEEKKIKLTRKRRVKQRRLFKRLTDNTRWRNRLSRIEQYSAAAKKERQELLVKLTQNANKVFSNPASQYISDDEESNAFTSARTTSSRGTRKGKHPNDNDKDNKQTSELNSQRGEFDQVEDIYRSVALSQNPSAGDPQSDRTMRKAKSTSALSARKVKTSRTSPARRKTKKKASQNALKLWLLKQAAIDERRRQIHHELVQDELEAKQARKRQYKQTTKAMKERENRIKTKEHTLLKEAKAKYAENKKNAGIMFGWK